jgi:hypothetical protein
VAPHREDTGDGGRSGLRFRPFTADGKACPFANIAVSIGSAPEAIRPAVPASCRRPADGLTGPARATVRRGGIRC